MAAATKSNLAQRQNPDVEAQVQRPAPLRFVMHRYESRQPHFDLQLEIDGVLKTWKVSDGPSYFAGDRRLAQRMTDHTLDFAKFEGDIMDQGNGMARVTIWDQGVWDPEGQPGEALENGHLSFLLEGERLKGIWHLERVDAQENWVLRKEADSFAKPASEADAFMAHETGGSVQPAAQRPQHYEGASAFRRHRPQDVMWVPTPTLRPSFKKRRIEEEMREGGRSIMQPLILFIVPWQKGPEDMAAVKKAALEAGIAVAAPDVHGATVLASGVDDKAHAVRAISGTGRDGALKRVPGLNALPQSVFERALAHSDRHEEKVMAAHRRTGEQQASEQKAKETEAEAEKKAEETAVEEKEVATNKAQAAQKAAKVPAEIATALALPEIAFREQDLTLRAVYFNDAIHLFDAQGIDVTYLYPYLAETINNEYIESGLIVGESTRLPKNHHIVDEGGVITTDNVITTESVITDVIYLNGNSYLSSDAPTRKQILDRVLEPYYESVPRTTRPRPAAADDLAPVTFVAATDAAELSTTPDYNAVRQPDPVGDELSPALAADVGIDAGNELNADADAYYGADAPAPVEIEMNEPSAMGMDIGDDDFTDVLDELRDDNIETQESASPSDAFDALETDTAYLGVSIARPNAELFPGSITTRREIAGFYAEAMPVLFPFMQDQPVKIIMVDEKGERFDEYAEIKSEADVFRYIDKGAIAFTLLPSAQDGSRPGLFEIKLEGDDEDALRVQAQQWQERLEGLGLMAATLHMGERVFIVVPLSDISMKTDLEKALKPFIAPGATLLGDDDERPLPFHATKEKGAQELQAFAQAVRHNAHWHGLPAYSPM